MKITYPMIFSLEKGDLKVRSTACGATFRRAFAGFACAAAALMLNGCAGSVPFFGEVDVMGRGAVLTQDRVNSLGRPPKQIVYRYDDHRYIENDPSGGYIGGCQGEMYYVDEKLGIRTLFGGNSRFVPKGVFKIDEKAPFVAVRDQENDYISFDQGRSFEPFGGAADMVVVGNVFFLGEGSSSYKLEYAFRSKEIEKANYNKKLRKNGGLELFDKSKRYFEDKQVGKTYAPRLVKLMRVTFLNVSMHCLGVGRCTTSVRIRTMKEKKQQRGQHHEHTTFL